MHPEDDPKMNELLERMREVINKEKERLKEAKYKADVLKEALKLIKVPDEFRELVDGFMSVAEQVGTNRVNITELQYLLFTSLEHMDKQFSGIYDSLAGLDAKR